MYSIMPPSLPDIHVRSRPRQAVIGVTTRPLTTGGLSLDVVERAYGEAISSVGGTSHLLPCQATPTGESLAGLDGLLLTGGGDVEPGLYGEIRRAETGGVDEDRDIWEIALLQQAFAAALPVLGICRGCQVINVACGGTLFQHLPDVTAQPHLIPHPRHETVHTVRIEPGSRLSMLEDNPCIGVNSIHHQAIDRVGTDLEATAWSEDGIVEAVEHLTLPVLGVQWHPENLLHLPAHRALFSWLVNSATPA
jgi:putative glutamine amidotransferase